ncbi:MAG: sulfoxide reductase heme-binding subunit YedZ [Proteobacteria bacterium]|jgi:methionine sulfoxide reductase heme-binding subunit|nr:sulfoxide reductase heme-binding subunit YedZ [Pseudomonadota bacterium]MCG6935470.1 sulfoxide reductase heme-binding subunit YedZ [Pseudomonadota bacterium]
MPLTRFQLIKSILFLVCLVPMVNLVWGFYADRLGANPFEALTRQSGEWTLRFLLLTLLMTPLREILQQAWPLRLRRMFGLFTFFYALFHLITYLWLDQFFDWQEIATDILKRPFITAGMLAFTLLVPLAFTSTRAMMRRLGRRWKSLHRSIYLIGVLAVLHYLWLVKADLREPLIYAGLMISLLGYRVWKNWRKRAPLRTQAGIN